MRLTKLEIFGFKSFAKRTEIVFPQNVTGIVGPNGSGKSNISDAVRWVLGEQSAKMLRGNSMSDVIFNGTETKKPMNYCEVTLVFDNADHQLPLAYAEVSITRRVYRSGDSEYLLNGAGCRLKDIVDLFRDTGVGKEGYSIIGQGRIDEILSQRGEDRRAVFEEAAGISRFRTRKEEAETRLKHSDENLVRVLDVLEELGNHLAPLKKQSDTAKEFLRLSDMLKELDVRLFLARYDRQKKKELAADQALLAIKDALLEADNALADFTARRERGEEALADIQRALGAAHDALLKANDLAHESKEQQAAIENRLQNGAETLQRLQAEGDSINSKLKLIQATLTQEDGGMGRAEELLKAAQASLDERKQKHAQATEAAAGVEAELEDHKSDLMARMNRMQDVRTSQARQTAMQQQMTARRAELASQLETEQNREQPLADALSQAKQNLAGEEARLAELTTGAQSLEDSTKALLSGILERQKHIQEDAQSARALDTRLKTLKELQDGYEGYQYPVRNALSYARRKQLSGVRDVVAMLLHVPKQYETAIDMALGGSMQNIVTETERDAQQMIDYLRQNKLGRATFLPMSAVRGRTLSPSERRVLDIKGCVGVASELCGFDSEYRGVIESLLGRTVVAEDLDAGIQIMRAGNHAFRLVTLQGDVMHSGGSMTGGSIQQKAQNLLGREREMKELEASLAELDQRMKAAQRELADMEAERAGEKERREAAQYALHQQEIAVVRDGERLKAAQADYDAHARDAQSYQSAIDQLDESLAEIAEELNRIERESTRQSMSEDELKARGETLSQQLDKARRERERAQEALTDAMLTLQNAQNDCDRIRRDQNRLLGDVDACRKELAELERKRERANQDIAAAEGERGQAAQRMQDCEQQVEAAKTHVADMELKQEQCQRSQRDIQNEIDAAQQLSARETDRLHRQELALTRLRADLSQLTDRLWNSYELSYAGAVEERDAYDARAAGETSSNGETVQQGNKSPHDPPADEDGDAKPRVSAPFDEAAAEASARDLRERIRAMGTVNVGAIDEYAQSYERFTQLSAQKDDLERAKQDLQTLISQLLSQMENVFVTQFELMKGYFAETFTRLFGGGHGEIALTSPNDPLNCGIDIIVQPPGKKRQLLSLFSGGERALTAIAILFAMLKLKPTPFCILDEIEAALDDANISYFAEYLKEFSADTQFIVVTHRKGTMERCDTLFGVAMEERGVSSMVSVNLTDYE